MRWVNAQSIRWALTGAAGVSLVIGGLSGGFQALPTVFGQVIDDSVPVVTGQVPPVKTTTIHLADSSARGTVTIPAHALSQPFKVYASLTTFLPKTVGKLPRVLQVVTVTAANKAHQPVNYFARPIQIHLQLSQPLKTPIVAVFWNALLGRWQPFPDITVHGATVSFDTKHFTVVAVAPAHGIALLQRLGTANDVGTAALLSLAAYPDGASSAVLVNAADPGTALVSLELAGANQSPLLYTGATTLPTMDLTMLRAMHVHTVYLVGGPRVVSPALARELTRQGYQVVRDFAGRSLASTALLVNQYVMANRLSSANTVYVVGNSAINAAVAAGVSIYGNAAPVVPVSPNQTRLSALEVATLMQEHIHHVVVLGNIHQVSAGVYHQLVGVFGDTEVQRVAGSTAFQTNAEVDASQYPAPVGVVAANGTNTTGLMDGLAAAPLAWMNGVPIVVTNRSALTRPVATYLHDRVLHAGWLVGGVPSLNFSVFKAIAYYVVAP
ncbi:MAG: cell wall-binding repeat-containing protein [Firmicutes bacterium]|nr:cell wall-binding repeat-containing protein [Bacillota bacterium]